MNRNTDHKKKINEFSKAFDEMTYSKDKIKELSVSFDTGNIKITAFPIISGIYLSLNEVNGSVIPFDEKIYRYNLITINQCLDGRCEFKHPEEAVSYISPQLTCIARKRRMDAFYYPLGHYTGLEISIIESLIDGNTREFLRTFSIDIEQLIIKYLEHTDTFIGKSDNRLLTLFRELYQLVTRKNLGRIRLKLLEIFELLLSEDVISPSKSNYLTSGQAAMARRAHDILTSDLSRHIAVHEISSKLGISETGLKNYFREVYGSGISDYMKEKRMKYAADKLQNTSLSVLDIANSIGYSNQGRFARVFYEHYKCKPLEYRRNHTTRE
ncbi:MAG: helix-turn-helix transcriptional regulator [Eubacterium sp.]|nr:helix-turn-helix transcriptional regulator [Eubacterium sp.]